MIYLACPYSHQDPDVRQRRFEFSCLVAYRLMKSGNTVFSPLSHSHPIEKLAISRNGETRRGWEFWSNQDLPILEKCDRLMVLMLPGWKESKGVKDEIAFAQSHDIWVEYVNVLNDKKYRDICKAMCGTWLFS